MCFLSERLNQFWAKNVVRFQSNVITICALENQRVHLSTENPLFSTSWVHILHFVQHVFPIDECEKGDNSHILVNFARVKVFKLALFLWTTRWTAINERSTLFWTKSLSKDLSFILRAVNVYFDQVVFGTGWKKISLGSKQNPPWHTQQTLQVNYLRVQLNFRSLPAKNFTCIHLQFYLQKGLLEAIACNFTRACFTV